ncbi:MAG: 3'-5' exonuclease [Opitutales bacterium]
MDWREARVHVIDFEGTPRSGVVEYGIITLFGAMVVETATRFCAPVGELAPADVRLHGIHETDTTDQPPLADDFDRFMRLRQEGPFCAHHAPVEMNLLKAAWPYPGSVRDFSQPRPAQIVSWGPLLDTRRIYASIYPELESCALEALLECFSLKPRLAELSERYCPPRRRKPHCALYDALGSALLLLRLNEEPSMTRLSLAQLFELSAARALSEPTAQAELGFESGD